MTRSVQLTDDEKRYIAGYLRHRSQTADAVFTYGAYILPSLLFAMYALWKADFVAALVAYAALLVVALLYLGHAKKSSDTFRSILEKFEVAASTQAASPP